MACARQPTASSLYEFSAITHFNLSRKRCVRSLRGLTIRCADVPAITLGNGGAGAAKSRPDGMDGDGSGDCLELRSRCRSHAGYRRRGVVSRLSSRALPADVGHICCCCAPTPPLRIDSAPTPHEIEQRLRSSLTQPRWLVSHSSSTPALSLTTTPTGPLLAVFTIRCRAVASAAGWTKSNFSRATTSTTQWTEASACGTRFCCAALKPR
jgi:hypothetical protein